VGNNTEEVGYEISHWSDERTYPAAPGNPASEEVERAKHLLEIVKKEIDDKDNTVVLWGLVALEYGIVRGTKADRTSSAHSDS
jgi:hypothetical protein